MNEEKKKLFLKMNFYPEICFGCGGGMFRFYAIINIPSWQNQQKITVEELIVSAILGYVAWNRTKNKLLHSDFFLILPTGLAFIFLRICVLFLAFYFLAQSTEDHSFTSHDKPFLDNLYLK